MHNHVTLPAGRGAESQLVLLAEVLVDEADEARQLPLVVEIVNVAFLGKAACIRRCAYVPCTVPLTCRVSVHTCAIASGN